MALQKPVCGQQEALVKSPNEKSSPGTVPDAESNHGDDQSTAAPAQPAAQKSQREKQVIANPG